MEKPKMDKAVFIDRDDTINRDVPYCSRPEDLELLPRVIEAIRLLNQHGFKIVVITNQSGIARGYFSEQTLEQIHRRMREELARGGAVIDAIYYCPHHPQEGCKCRKPQPTLLWRAAQELNLDVRRSFTVGDRPEDVQMGKEAGCLTVLVPRDSSWKRVGKEVAPDYVAADLYEAAAWIINRDRETEEPSSLSPGNKGVVQRCEC